MKDTKNNKKSSCISCPSYNYVPLRLPPSPPSAFLPPPSFPSSPLYLGDDAYRPTLLLDVPVSCLRDILGAAALAPLSAQPVGAVSGSQFELADTVQLDQVDHAVLAQWERAKALLADRQWDEAIEILGQLAESSEGKLLGVTNRRYVSLQRLVPVAVGRAAARGLETLSRAASIPSPRSGTSKAWPGGTASCCRTIVDQAFASTLRRPGVDGPGRDGPGVGRLCRGAVVLGADRAGGSRQGPGSGARFSTHRSEIGPRRPGSCPLDPRIPTWRPAAVRPALVLVSILEGLARRATGRTGRVRSAAPRRAGPVGRPRGKIRRSVENAAGRKHLLARCTRPIRTGPPFAGNPQRNRIASRAGGRRRGSVANAAWHVPSWHVPAPSDRRFEPARWQAKTARAVELLSACWSASLVLVNDSRRILAMRLDTGKPAWGQAAIYRKPALRRGAAVAAARHARIAAFHHDRAFRTSSSPGWARR